MKSSNCVAGIDEVGRGALAGPVVTCACLVQEDLVKSRSGGWHPARRASIRIADSKTLTPMQRETAAHWIKSHALYSFGIQTEKDVDRIGIVRATERAMQLAIDGIVQQMPITSVNVDGRDAFHFSVPHTSIIRGDSLDPCIAAASILAKVMRDALMTRAGAVFPAFGFEAHKGYGSEFHRKAILENGPCVLHRMTFLTMLREQLILC